MPGAGNECPLQDAEFAYRARQPFHEGRIRTWDDVGAKVPGVTLDRDPQAVHDAVAGGTGAVAGMVADALVECAAGRPAAALALGRDFFTLSYGEKELEDAAVRLLEAAYRALGRDALAEIAVIHHRHRRRPQVDGFGVTFDE